jgi:6-pyruvoyltetrahydropterin/6-carboxytetrahydropterin synthase
MRRSDADNGGAMKTSVTVNVAFEAAHRLHNPERSDDWNRQVFGKCNNLHGHGHNYVVEVTVEGEVDQDSGYLIDMKDLKQVLREAVVDDVDHRHMNFEVPWLAGVIPTAENLARVFFERVDSRLDEAVRLEALTVHETPRNSATYARP